MKNFTNAFTNLLLNRFIVLMVLMVSSIASFSQNIGISASGTAPNPAAGLDVDFPNKGLLIPRVALTGTANFTPLAAHVAGMVVYNTATAGDVTPGFYYNNGTKWVPGFPAGSSIGTMLYWNGTSWVMIPVGGAGQVLQLNASGIPAWGGGTFATIITTVPSAVTGVTATSGGNITADGGSPILTRGICYNTLPNPTAANSIITASPQTGTGVFSCNLTGLTPVTTYYVRAFAVNSSIVSYGNEVSFTTLPVLPILTTTAATAITGTTAVSGGNVTSNGGSTITERGICYATTANPTTVNTKIIDPAPGLGIFVSNLTGLTQGLTYYVRAYAITGAGTAYGNQISFATLQTPPTIVTTTATGITPTSAISGGSYTLNGTGGNLWNYGVAYATVPNSPTPTYVQTGTTPIPNPFVTNLTGLLGNTTYYIRAYIQGYWNGAGSYDFGNELSFTTPAPVLPTVATRGITNIGPTSALSGGNVSSNGGANVTTRGVCWGTSPNPDTLGSKISSGSGTGIFAITMTPLTGSTTYHVRAYAVNSVGIAYGGDSVFTTCAPPIYTIGQMAEGGVVFYVDCTGQHGLVAALSDQGTGIPYGCQGTLTGATGSAIFSGMANTNAILLACPTPGIAAQLCRSYNGGGYTDWYCPSIGELQEMYNQRGVIPNLTTGVYTYWSSTEGGATVASGFFFYGGYVMAAMKGYGTQMVVRAIRAFNGISLPTISTDPVINITATTATSGGTITGDGGSPVTARGVCWSTTTGPTTANSKTLDGTGIGTFISNITGLTLGTTYYVRAYATNSLGTAYGNELSFIAAPPVLPTLTTDPISGMTATSAVSGGNITSDGGAVVTVRGVCWGTVTNPTIALATKTNDGAGSGAFVSNITGLTTGTTYYLRAYATNIVGTAYGNEVIFTPTNLPTVTTNPIGSLIGAIAAGSGIVESEGGAPVTAFGLCWNTVTGPTVTVNLGKTTDLNGIFGTPWSYFHTVSGLTIGTTYYVRAYATNSFGTSYGAEVSFTAAAATLGQSVIIDNLSSVVFNVDGTGLHGLIADLYGWGEADWGCDATVTGASGIIVGTGLANTTAIISSNTTVGCISISPIGTYAAEITKFDGADWYLPSKDEFTILWNNRGVDPTLDANISAAQGLAPFWSSSEVDAGNAWNFDGTTWFNVGAKASLNNVWAIRSF